MNQTERATSVTGTDIAAAIQDERITGLERRMEMVIRSVVAIETVEALDRRIEQLERRAALIEEQRLQVIANTAVIREQSDTIHALRVWCADHVRRIVELERLTDRLVDRQVELLKVAMVEQGMRIERLEESWRMLQHKLLNFSSGATYTAEHAKQIEDWGSGSR